MPFPNPYLGTDFLTDEKFLYFYTEYGDLERLLYGAENTRSLTPNVSLTQCRMILEILINGIIDNGETLKNRILHLKNFYNVDDDIIDAMNQVRQMGNAGVHFQQVYLKEATQSLKFLFKIMHWYGSTNNFIRDENLLSDVQFCVAQCYKDGIGTDSDSEKNILWLKKACANKNMYALRDLAVNYFYGAGVPKNFQKSVEYLKQAVAKNSSDAEYFLGMLYIGNYEEIKRDKNSAYELFQSAAKKGNLLAEYNLLEYFNRFEMEKLNRPYDPKKNFSRYLHIVKEAEDNKLYERLAIKALLQLGDFYQYGLGTEKNFEKSFDCYLKAAKKENDVAYYKLGQCYENGIGVAKNPDKAEEFYSIAALMGHPAAKNKVNSITYLKYKNKLKGKF